MKQYEPHYKLFKRHWISENVRHGNNYNRLIKTWDDAVDFLKKKDPDGRNHTLSLLEDTELYKLLKEQAVQSVYRGGRSLEEAQHDLREFALILAFERWGRKIIRPSIGLARMLEATKPTLPLCSIKPPYPLTYLWLRGLGFSFFTSEGEMVEIEGIYVSYEMPVDQHTGRQGIRLVLGLVAEGGVDFVSNSIAFYADDETPAHEWFLSKESLQAAREEALEGGQSKENADRIVSDAIKVQSLMLNVFAYMSSPEGKADTRVESSKLLRQYDKAKTAFEKAKLKNEVERTFPTENISIGQSITIPGNAVYAPSVSDEESERTVCTHWRRGHWRHVWLGPHDHPDRHREARWIRPVLINPGVSAEPQQVFFKLKEKSS
jgi:hypothetical protein